MLDLSKLVTESVNERSIDLDTMTPRDIIKIINDEDRKVSLAITTELPIIEKVIADVVMSIKNGGRLFLCGAGTSGRLAVMEASECPPTFSTPYDLIQGVMAGAPDAFFKAVEGAEDIEENGIKDAKQRGLCGKDFVIGVSASGRTPYVVGFLKYAKSLGCRTTMLSSCRSILEYCDFMIAPNTGSEVLTGSTRMKAGTAAKMILNMITTTSMVMLGKVYGNQMIDVNPNSEKLIDRAARIVMHITKCSREEAVQLVQESKNAKVAVVMYVKKVDKIAASEMLQKHENSLRKTLRESNHACENI